MLDDAEVLLKRLLRLVQVASNPATIDQSYKRTSWQTLAFGQPSPCEAVDAGDKIIVWTSFTGNAGLSGIAPGGIWCRRSRTAGFSLAIREEALDTFKTDPECRVLVATPGAAKEGLTLTVANHAVFFDRSFSLDDYLQAQDRIHRISQDKPCHVTNLVATGTVDSLGWTRCWPRSIWPLNSGKAIFRVASMISRADYAFGEMVRDVLRTRRGS